METNSYYAMVYKKEFDDTPLPKRFIVESLERLDMSWDNRYLVTKLDFGTCVGEYKVNTYVTGICSEDQMVDFLFNMSLTHSLSKIKRDRLRTFRFPLWKRCLAQTLMLT